GANTDDVTVAASVKLPAGWKLGTSLPIAREAGGQMTFAPVSLPILVDSPVLAGGRTPPFPPLPQPPGRPFLPPPQPGRPARQTRANPRDRDAARRGERAVRRPPLHELHVPPDPVGPRGGVRPGASRVERRPHVGALPHRRRSRAQPGGPPSARNGTL